MTMTEWESGWEVLPRGNFYVAKWESFQVNNHTLLMINDIPNWIHLILILIIHYHIDLLSKILSAQQNVDHFKKVVASCGKNAGIIIHFLSIVNCKYKRKSRWAIFPTLPEQTMSPAAAAAQTRSHLLFQMACHITKC